MVEACKEAGDSKIKCKPQNKWFDQECETEKENSQSLGENISHNISNSEQRQLQRDKKKSSNKLADGRNRSLSAKACLISIYAELRRDLATNRKNL